MTAYYACFARITLVAILNWFTHFKILFFTLNGMAPAYINDLIYERKHARYSLRSNSDTILSHPAGKIIRKSVVIDLLV